MNARIVRASEKDLAGISELAGRIWRAHYPGIISQEQISYMLARMYSMAALREDVCVRRIWYDRLLVDDEFLGFAACGVEGDSSSHGKEGPTVKLHKLYLHPDWHGKGLGTLLLQHCEREARALGAGRLVLTVNKRNAKAIAAYERNGFANVRSAITDIGGGFAMDDYVMEKRLTALGAEIPKSKFQTLEKLQTPNSKDP